MKKFLFFIFLDICFLNLYGSRENKYALIVAIKEYKDKSWNNLKTDKDIDLMTSALKKQGFCDSNIIIVKNNSATKKNIVKAFERHLINKAKEGSLCFFHFSGHGQQVKDEPNGDEPDGFDESLVCYDAYRSYNVNEKNAEFHLKDDEISDLLARLSNKVGKAGHIVLTFDACHSGTVTRGFGTTRGAAEPFSSDYANTRVTIESQSEKFGNDLKGNNNNVFSFFACQPHQQNSEYDGNNCGSLSYAFSEAVSRLQPYSTFQNLYEMVYSIMQTECNVSNIPQFEGSLSSMVFNGDIKSIVKFHRIRYENRKPIIDLSGVHNVGIGSLFNLYSNGIQDTFGIQPIGRARVNYVYGNSSEIEFLNEIPKDKLNTSVAVLAKHVFTTKLYTLFYFKTQKIQELINSKLKQQKFQFIETDTKSHDVRFREVENKIIIEYAQHPENDTINMNGLSEDAIVSDILCRGLDYYNGKYLRSLSYSNRHLKPTLEVLPIDISSSKDESNTICDRYSELIIDKKNIILKANQRFKIRVKNDMPQSEVFYAVVLIDCKNSVRILTPNLNHNPSDNFLSKKDTNTIINITRNYPYCSLKVAPPFGDDVVMLLTSSFPIENLYQFYNRGENCSTKRGTADESLEPERKSNMHIEKIILRTIPDVKF